MTFQYSPEARWRGTNRELFESPANWISPNSDAPAEYDYKSNPPAADGTNVIISDTDHLWGIGGDIDWVWKSFTRGHNLLFMDPYDNSVLGKMAPQSWEPVRANLGYARRMAEQSDLAAMKPMGWLASTEFCLAHPNQSYIVYAPDGGQIRIDLTEARGAFTVSWLSPATGAITHADRTTGGSTRSLAAPFSGAAVLLLLRTDKD